MAKLKRLAAPAFWKISRKVAKWAVSPRPGPHKKFEALPLQVVVRDILKLAETGKEARTIIKAGEILVDGKVRKDHAFPAGLFDAIVIPRIKKFYRVLPAARGLELREISDKESAVKICRIENKRALAKGKLQLNLHDGRNVLVEKDVYSTGDSLLISLPEQKILDHVKLERGNLVLISAGKNAGKSARIRDIVKNKALCEVKGKKLELSKGDVVVIGKEKALVKVS